MSKNHYVDNAKFYEALREYRSTEGQPNRKPPSDYIGDCILLICRKFATKSNFWQYSYSDEMANDAVLDCVGAIDNFDCEKFKNPHAYFTKIAMYAFFRRIESEKEQAYLKVKSLDEAILDDPECGADRAEIKKITIELSSKYERKRSTRKSRGRRGPSRRIG